MKTITLVAALSFAAPAFAQQAHDPGRHAPAPGTQSQAEPQHQQHGQHAMVHPGARGFVQRPAWHRVARVAQHPHFHFRFHGRNFVVIAGPIYVQPWVYYPFVSTPDYPATFWDPNDPGAGYNLYYCPSPAGYFPDVTDCPAGWWSTAPEEPGMEQGY
jgi:hypothetical protein